MAHKRTLVHLQDEVLIEAPIDVVFAMVTDLPNTPKWHRNMKRVGFRTSDPPGVGSEYEWVERFLWKSMDLSGVITAWDRPNGFSWRPKAGPFPMTGGWRFEAIEAATKVTRFSETELTGVMRLMPGPMKSIARRQVRAELADLKRLIETSHRAATLP